MLADAGVVLERDGHGAGATWRRAPRILPLFSQSYREALGLGVHGWRGNAGVRRLYYDERGLVASFRQSGGAITLPVDVALASPGILVLEVAGQGLIGAEVAVTGEDTTIVVELRVPPDSFRYVTVDLPPGRYRSIGLAAHPQPGLQREDPSTGLIIRRYGRIVLRSMAVYPQTDAAQ